jgi:hypothetical protein
MRVFLDDDRNHGEDGWTMVRTVPALMRLLERHGGEVTHISFDNDLRQPLEGWEGVRDILERVQDDPGFLPVLASVQVHSLNTGAVERMVSKLENAVRCGVIDAEVSRLPAFDGIHPLAREDRRAVDVFD